MIFEVAIGDKVRTVGIVRKGALLHVDLDGRTHIVDARRVNDAVVSMLVQLDGAQRAVAIDRCGVCAQAGRRRLRRASRRPHHPGADPPGRLVRASEEGTAPAAQATGPQRVTAPMPGKVVRVLVKPGDEVKARQGLVVVEAMKMENELRAARDGRVRDVAVAEGQSVDAGAVLLIVE